MVGIIVGAFVFAGGVGLTALSPKGISAILSMMGAVVAFCASVVLVFVWVIREIFEKEEKRD